MRAAAAERDAQYNERFSRILGIVEKQAGNIDKLAAIAPRARAAPLERLES
jgi:hypothetical protein